MPPDTGGAPSRNRSLLAVEGSDHPLADLPGSRGLQLDRSLPGADEGFRGLDRGREAGREGQGDAGEVGGGTQACRLGSPSPEGERFPGFGWGAFFCYSSNFYRPVLAR